MSKYNDKRIAELENECKLNKKFIPPTPNFIDFRLEIMIDELNKRRAL